MEKEVVKLTKVWIERFVIGLRLCPFAHYSYFDDRIYYDVSQNQEMKECIVDSIEVVIQTKNKGKEIISNAFLIFEKTLSFDFMLKLKEEVDSYFEDTPYDGLFQTVIFHPEFQFANEGFHAAGNFTNRSPSPMIHFLRVDEVTKAIKDTPNVDDIPFINKKLLEKIKIQSVSEVFEENFMDKIKTFT